MYNWRMYYKEDIYAETYKIKLTYLNNEIRYLSSSVISFDDVHYNVYQNHEMEDIIYDLVNRTMFSLYDDCLIGIEAISSLDDNRNIQFDINKLRKLYYTTYDIVNIVYDKVIEPFDDLRRKIEYIIVKNMSKYYFIEMPYMIIGYKDDISEHTRAIIKDNGGKIIDMISFGFKENIIIFENEFDFGIFKLSTEEKPIILFTNK